MEKNKKKNNENKNSQNIKKEILSKVNIFFKTYKEKLENRDFLLVYNNKQDLILYCIQNLRQLRWRGYYKNVDFSKLKWYNQNEKEAEMSLSIRCNLHLTVLQSERGLYTKTRREQKG